MQVVGNYNLNLEIGGVVTTIVPQMIREFTIALDAERILPTFKLVLKDATKILSDILPYDSSSNTVRIQISRTSDITELNTFDFQVKRRNTASPDDVYSIEGILDVPTVVTKNVSRALSGNLRDSLRTVASDELEIPSTEIGASLDYEKTIIQPNWTNAKLLRYLRENLIGQNDECGYYIFVKVVHGEKILVIKSINELLSSPIKYKFLVGHRGYKDLYPVSHYRVFDNSALFSDLGAQTRAYKYFDWNTGTYQNKTIPITDCPALSEFFLVDSDNDSNSVLYTGTGRSNEFTSDFQGRIRNQYYRRINSNVNLWISTWGIENISPGDIVQVYFSEGLGRDTPFLFQHTGAWMVKRVVHIIGSTFMSNLELIRCGIDTDVSNTLVKTVDRRSQ